MLRSARLEEYKALRQEIDSRARLVVQVFTASLMILVPFISGIAIYVLRNQADMKANPSALYPYMFLLPLLILIPCTWLLASLRKDFFRCGTYIEVFLEDDSELRWETALSKFRKGYSEESFDPLFAIYWMLFGICGGLFGYTLHLLSLPWLHFLAALGPGLVLFKSHWNYRAIPTKVRNDFSNKWRDVKQALNNKTCNSK